MAQRLALLSVFNKNGVVDFAKGLIDLDFDLMASGGTAKVLAEAGLPVMDVAKLVGGEAILGHRVVTLSRELYAALLSTDSPEDVGELAKLGIRRIDLVCVDMYPLQEAIEDPSATVDSVIEKTDVGGPTMLHGGAKGGRIVVCDPADRAPVLAWLREGMPNEKNFIRMLRAKAEYEVANYVFASAQFHGEDFYGGLQGSLVRQLRYGENPHQPFSALYATKEGEGDRLGLPKLKLVGGEQPSCINITDLDRLITTAVKLGVGLARGGMPQHFALAVKHGNACGAGCHNSDIGALKRMVESDPVSLFGGSVLVNFEIDERHGQLLRSYLSGEERRLDVVIAPSFTQSGIAALKRVNGRCRMYVNPALAEIGDDDLPKFRSLREVRGGFLMQDPNRFVLKVRPEWTLHDEQVQDLILAWAIGSTATSNSIVVVKDGTLLGRGLAQPSRVFACKVAVLHVRENGHEAKLKGALAYSDSFFPFVDGPEVLADAGIGTIFTTNGALRDAEVERFCQSRGITLLWLPDKEARGFFGH